jgi:putative Mn2+ efflux pump MntP
VFEGEKTMVFWVGLLVFGYSLVQFCSAIWQTIYYVAIYPRVFSSPLSSGILEAEELSLQIPLIISGVIFAVIGLYMMKKGVKQQQPSTQN